MSQSVVAELAPHGVLRAAINMSNFLLVTGSTPSGDPEGVSPDMARAIADRLGVPVKYVPFPKPGELADAVGSDAWDIGLIGAEPARAEKIVFTAAYVEIEATYLVPAGSPLQSIADVDRPGVRIAVTASSAYDLWLERNIKHAELVRSTASPVPPRSSSATSWMPGRTAPRPVEATSRRCPVRGSSTGSFPPCSRRSALRGPTPPVRRSCTAS